MVLSISEGGFFGARTAYGKVCFGDASLRKYTQKYIKPMSNINNIICVSLCLNHCSMTICTPNQHS